MKIHRSNHIRRVCRLVRRLSFLAVIATFAGSARADDNYEFTDPLTSPADTNGWVQIIDYSDVQGSFAIANGGYRLQTSSATDTAAVSTYPPDLEYTNFQVSVDVIDWNRTLWPTNMGSINVFARAKNVDNPAAIQAYLLFLRPNGDTNIPSDGKALAGIFSFDNGRVTFQTFGSFRINLNDQYRLVFTGNGPALTGQIFDLTNLVNPVFLIQTNDSAYTSGSVGILADDDAAVNGYGRLPVDFTVNNFRAGPPTPQLNIQQTVTLSWPDSYAGYVLQTATNLNGPWQSSNVTPHDSAGIYTATLGANYSSEYFRLSPP